MWHGGESGEADLLASCYREALALADEVAAESVAFPANSTGIFGYPSDAAAEVAVRTVRSTPTSVGLVQFFCFDQTAWDA